MKVDYYFFLVKFTQEEKELLKSIGNRDYLLDSQEYKVALLSLVDILFAYAYDYRTTFGEESVESAWTINKLSSTLSWLQVTLNNNYLIINFLAGYIVDRSSSLC